MILTGAFIVGVASGALINFVIWTFRAHDRPQDVPESKDKAWFANDVPECTKCGTALKRRQTSGVIALVSGMHRCAKCGRPLFVPKLLIEVICGAVWLASVYILGATLSALTVAAYGTLLLGIAIADFRSWLIPHEFTWIGIILSLGLSLSRGITGLINAALGTLVGPAIFFVVAWLVAKLKRISVSEALGGGDYWLIAMIGGFVGWKMVPVAIVLSAVTGLVIFLPWVIRATLRHTESPKIPFGVFLALGGAATLLVGERLVSWYGHWALRQ